MFFTNLGDLSACFPHLCPRHSPTRHLPACYLASPGRMRPRREGRSLGRLGLANIVTEEFEHGFKMASQGSGIPPKRGNKQRCLPGTAACAHPAQIRTDAGAEEGPLRRLPPHPSPLPQDVSRAWEINPHSRPLHAKYLGKGEQILTLFVAAFSSPH